MPKFEIRRSQEREKATVPAQQMSYAPVQRIAQAGEEAAETIDYIAKTWAEAERTSQLTTATNNLVAQTLNFEADLNKDDLSL